MKRVFASVLFYVEFDKHLDYSLHTVILMLWSLMQPTSKGREK